jgi:hypothetical protein
LKDDGIGVTEHVEALEIEVSHSHTSMPHDAVVAIFPEGGFKAWMAVVGGFLCFFITGVVSLSSIENLLPWRV